MNFVSLAETNVRSDGEYINSTIWERENSSISDYIFLAPLVKQYYNPEIIVIQLSVNDFRGENGEKAFAIM